MAWHTITPTCGHDYNTQLAGTSKSSEWKARKMSAQPCEACDTAARLTEATATATAAGMPQLTGSDRQITWATDIRSHICDEANGATPDGPIGRVITANRRGRTLTRTGRSAIAAEIVALIAGQTEARWWIDLQGPRSSAAVVRACGGAEVIDQIIARHTAADDKGQPPAPTNTAAAEVIVAAGEQEPDARTHIVALRAAGRTVRQIAAAIGVATSTIYRWAAGHTLPRRSNATALTALNA